MSTTMLGVEDITGTAASKVEARHATNSLIRMSRSLTWHFALRLRDVGSGSLEAELVDEDV